MAASHAASRPATWLRACALAALCLVATAAGSTPRSAQAAIPAACGVSQAEADLDAGEADLFTRINTYRRSQGMPEFRSSPGLNAAAAHMALDMRAIFSDASGHVDSHGHALARRVELCGYPFVGLVAENILWGEGIGDPAISAEYALAQWLASPTHRRALDNPAYTMIGIARAHRAGTPWNADYWVTDFGDYDDSGGEPDPPTPPAPSPPPPPPPPPLGTTLHSGANLVSWPDADTPVAEAIAGIGQTVVAVYGWDASAGRWLRYLPHEGAPWLNTLTTLVTGRSYWIMAA